MLLGAECTGRIAKFHFRRLEISFRASQGMAEDEILDYKIHQQFPLEKARLQTLAYLIPVFVTATSVYGYSTRTHISVALIVQFIMAFTSNATLTISQTYITDLFPSESASAVALTNLGRCILAAISTEMTPLAVKRLGSSLTFTVVGSVSLMTFPLLICILFWGHVPRQRRMEREAMRL